VGDDFDEIILQVLESVDRFDSIEHRLHGCSAEGIDNFQVHARVIPVVQFPVGRVLWPFFCDKREQLVIDATFGAVPRLGIPRPVRRDYTFRQPRAAGVLVEVFARIDGEVHR